jgi:hypothetical protein
MHGKGAAVQDHSCNSPTFSRHRQSQICPYAVAMPSAIYNVVMYVVISIAPGSLLPKIKSFTN